MTATFDTFFTEIAVAIGADAINRSEETLRRYSENTMPGGDRQPALRPCRSGARTEDRPQCQRAWRATLSDQHRQQYRARQPFGLACRTSRVDLGYRMNHPRDRQSGSGFAVVEPGVSYQAMYDELVRRGSKLMLDVTSGRRKAVCSATRSTRAPAIRPTSIISVFACGMEVVLGNGGRDAHGRRIAQPRPPGELVHVEIQLWADPDGLFTQSNFGIVTRMGVWLLPRLPAVQSFHFVFPRRRRSRGEIIELARPMKMSNFVPSPFRVANDLYLCGSEGEPGIPREQWQEVDLRPGRRALQQSTGSALDAIGSILRTQRRRHRAADRARVTIS
jgi:4-cresol dehydrogenase (hydroxylating)